MLNYILIAYATMLLFVGIPVQIEIQNDKANTLTREDVTMVALAPVTFPLTIIKMAELAITGNGLKETTKEKKWIYSVKEKLIE